MQTSWIMIGGVIFGLVVVLLWIERWPWHIMRASTIRALGWLGLRQTITGGVHGILYARWGPQYIYVMRKLAKRFGTRGRKWMEDSYHGKVLSHDLASSIITLDRDLPLQDLGDQVIPYKRARDILLNSDTSYVLTDCVCKRDKHDHHGQPCKVASEPYYTCMFVGSPDLCDFLVDHKPATSKRLTREEALAKLDEFHDLGLVHNAWFKSCIKDQFYVICNCCSCCCLGFESMRHGIRQLTPSGFVAEVDEARCRSCGTCAAVCPFHAIDTVTDGTKTRYVVNTDKCYGGGVCIEKCPSGARRLVPDTKRGILPMDIRSLVTADSISEK
jgi:Pyruvate/2-oxoacid:ferredoxin oxidoreductase delta subunit